MGNRVIDVQKKIDLGRAAEALLKDETYKLAITTLLARCHTQIFRTAPADDAGRKLIHDRYHALEEIEGELKEFVADARKLVEAIENDELPQLLGIDPDADPAELEDDEI